MFAVGMRITARMCCYTVGMSVGVAMRMRKEDSSTGITIFSKF